MIKNAQKVKIKSRSSQDEFAHLDLYLSLAVIEFGTTQVHKSR